MSTTAIIRRSVLRKDLEMIPQIRHSSTVTSHLPRIAQPSLWSSIIPKFLRRPQHEPVSSTTPKRGAFKTWLRNPSTSLVILGMLTGSQAIQVMQLRGSIEERRQLAQRRIDTLKGVIERIQNGETVDLKKELGTGDPVAEAEWKEVVDQIADEAFWLLPKEKKIKEKKGKEALNSQYRRTDDDIVGTSVSSWWPFSSSGSKTNAKLTQAVTGASQSVEAEEQPVRRAFY